MSDDRPTLNELMNVPEVRAPRDDSLPSLAELLKMPEGASALMVALMAQAGRDRDFTANALIEAYRRDYCRARAELAAIRAEVGLLLSGKWMPTSDAITGALWPPDDIIDEYRLPEGAH